MKNEKLMLMDINITHDLSNKKSLEKGRPASVKECFSHSCYPHIVQPERV